MIHRTVFTALAAAAIVLPACAQDKPADPKKSRAEQLADIQADFRKVMPEIKEALQAARDKDAITKAFAKTDPFVERAYKLVAESPKDDVSLNALLFTMQTKPEPLPKSIDLLVEHHVGNPLLAPPLLEIAGRAPPAVKKLIEAAEKSPSKDVRGAVALSKARQKADDADEVRGETAAKMIGEADTELERASKEFGDVKIGPLTIAKMAEKSLFVLRNLTIGKTAPAVVSHDLDGKETTLSAHKGKVVVLDIWATWCGPCRQMIPHEREMVEKLKDRPFVLVSISADDEKEDLTKFLEKEKMPWIHWWEGQKESGIIFDWNVRFFPTIYVIDAKGVIRYKHVQGKDLEEAVEKLVKEAEEKK